MEKTKTMQIHKKNGDLNHKAKELLRELLNHGKFETTTYYAERAEISWNTAHHYLTQFARKHWIHQAKKGNRAFWKAISE